MCTINKGKTKVTKYLSLRLYSQFIRPKLGYGLAIIPLTRQPQQELEIAQINCLCKIYGSHYHSSVAIMQHLHKLHSMAERKTILRTHFLISILFLPEYALLTQILPIITQPKSKRHVLQQSPLWQQLPEPKDITSNSVFKAAKNHSTPQTGT